MVLFFPYLVADAGNQYKIGPLPGFYFTLSGIVHMAIFYVHAFLLYPKFLNRTYWWLYVAFVVILIFLSVQLKFYILEWRFPNASPDARTHVLFPSVLVFIASVFYCVVTDKIRAEKFRKENEAMQLGIELKFLRSQINPHFLFNTLTNVISLARKKSGDLETSLLMLSGLMRYMLYDAGKKIALQQEVEYLESYIALQKLRYEQDVSIVFNHPLTKEEGNYEIETMLLIPFVENAFKHGMDHPFIDISLTVKESVLFFEVKNKFDRETNTSKDESSGIGLNNVRSRLMLLYPGRHNLLTQADNNLFSIQLKLEL